MALHRSDNERLRAIAEGLAAEDPDYVELLERYTSEIAENPEVPGGSADARADALPRALSALVWAGVILAGVLLILVPLVSAGAG